MHLLADAVIGFAIIAAARRALRGVFGYNQARLPREIRTVPTPTRERAQPTNGTIPASGAPTSPKTNRTRDKDRDANTDPQTGRPLTSSRYLLGTSAEGDAATSAMMDMVAGPGILTPRR